MIRRSTILAFAFFFGLASLALADDAGDAERYWPRWRGPADDGTAPHGDPPLTWSEKENVRWKVPVPGSGHASPVVWGDRIFLLTAVPVEKAAPEPKAEEAVPPPEGQRRRPPPIEPAKQRFEVLALARDDGRVLWRKTAIEATPPEGTHADATFASASPVTDGERVFASFGSQGLYAYSWDGELLWSKDLGDMRTRNAFGEGSTPALHGDWLIVNWDHEGDSFIVALDAKTGAERWRRSRDDEPTSWASPVVATGGGKPQVIVAGSGRTRGYDLATGDVIWQAAGMTLNVVPTPIVDGDVVYVASGFRGNMMQAIRYAGARGELDAESPSLLWQHDRDTPYVPSPVLANGRLYFVKRNGGIVSCVDARTGEVRYAERLPDPDGVYASLVAASGRIYVAGRDGATAVLAAAPKLEILATNRLDDGFDASPAIVGDTIYLRGREHLYAITAPPKEGEAGTEPAKNR